VREKKKKRKEKNRGRRRSVHEVRRKPEMLGLGEIKEERWV
jgi:hypothetical protein